MHVRVKKHYSASLHAMYTAVRKTLQDTENQKSEYAKQTQLVGSSVLACAEGVNLNVCNARTLADSENYASRVGLQDECESF